MTDKQPPTGYEDAGQHLAQAVLEGFRSEAWALDIAKVLGYDRSALDAWLAFYRKSNRESLRWLQIKRSRRRSKIEALRAQAVDLSRDA